jgi:iron(III) transport system permease protein
MAVPAYVMGFIYMAMFDFAGPFQTFFRNSLGLGISFPSIRSGLGAVIVMTLVLYPYVYLLAKAGFEEQAGTAFEAAKVLGAGRLRTFFKVALPLARPSIAAGIALAAMESLADFATVRYFNFPTVADGILRVWHGLMNLGAASEIAGMLAFFSLIILLSEHKLRSRKAYYQNKGRNQGVPATFLTGYKGLIASIICGSVFFASFGLPLLQLMYWAALEITEITPHALSVYSQLALRSLTVSAAAAFFTVVAALFTASVSRLGTGKFSRYLARASTVGYSIPGAVIGVGILIPLSALDRYINNIAWNLWGIDLGLVFTGSLIGLVYAYVVRFMAIAYGSVDSSMDKIPPNTILAARVLGANAYRIIFNIKLPLILPGIIAGAVLVFVDVMKELPITVVLRPMSYDTLAIWVWQMAAESLWTDTALPALAIVLVGIVPVWMLMRKK